MAAFEVPQHTCLLSKVGYSGVGVAGAKEDDFFSNVMADG